MKMRVNKDTDVIQSNGGLEIWLTKKEKMAHKKSGMTRKYMQQRIDEMEEGETRHYPKYNTTLKKGKKVQPGFNVDRKKVAKSVPRKKK